MITKIFLTSFIGLFLALVLTPLAKWLGNRIGAVDIPMERKIHSMPIPRSGGLAIFLSFALSLLMINLVHPSLLSPYLFLHSKLIFAFLGAVLIFGTGFFDDIHRLRPRVKLLFQIIAASLAYFGGLKITTFAIGTFVLNFGMMSYFITIFWFVLLINAMNLIDGLDGLAAGVAFFACVIMTVIASGHSNDWTALAFAALAGVLLGFLRYNFNPASIFLGDGGSYFIGYTIAALSINGSLKSGLATTLLIPLLALGVPIFDTILSPLRRWILGFRMFSPDKGHIHHHLLKKGLSSQKAVLMIYGVTLLLCVAGLIILNMRNSLIAVFLLLLTMALFIAVRKIGYLEYLAVDKILGWFRDLSYEVGLDNERRSFLNLQLQIERADNMESLWDAASMAFKKLGIDRGELHYYKCAGETSRTLGILETQSYNGIERRHAQVNSDKCGVGGDDWTHKFENENEIVWLWTHGHCRRFTDVQEKEFFRTEIPLNIDDAVVHKLVIIKHLTTGNVEPNSLRRLHYLRSSIVSAMKKIKGQVGKC